MGFNSAFKGLNIVCHTLCKRDCVNWTVPKLTLAYSKHFELSTDITGLGVHIRNLRDFPLFHVSQSVDTCPTVSCANWVCSVLVFAQGKWSDWYRFDDVISSVSAGVTVIKTFFWHVYVLWLVISPWKFSPTVKESRCQGHSLTEIETFLSIKAIRHNAITQCVSGNTWAAI